MKRFLIEVTMSETLATGMRAIVEGTKKLRRLCSLYEVHQRNMNISRLVIIVIIALINKINILKRFCNLNPQTTVFTLCLYVC